MIESENLAATIYQEIKSVWPYADEVSIDAIPERLRWGMHCAGFNPHVFTQRKAVNKIIQVGESAYFFVSIQRNYLEMVDYWSTDFQFHGWYGPSKPVSSIAGLELKAANVCSEYRYEG